MAKPLTILYKISLLILICMAGIQLQAQKKYTILVGSKGQILPDLPERLYAKDVLHLHFVNHDDSLAVYINQFKKQLSAARENVNKLMADPDQLNLLSTVYGITRDDLLTIRFQLEAVAGNPATGAKYVPAFNESWKANYRIRFLNTDKPVDTTIEPNRTSAFYLVKLKDHQTQMEFSLLKNDPYKQLLLYWLDKTAEHFSANFNANEFLLQKEELKQLLLNIDQFVREAMPLLDNWGHRFLDKRTDNDNLSASEQAKLLQLMTSAGSLISKLNTLILNISKDIAQVKSTYREWVLHWLWFQKSNVPKLNPFGFLRPQDLPAEPDTSRLETLRRQIAVRERFYEKVNYEKMRIPQIDSILHAIDSLKKIEAGIKKEYTEYTTVIKENDKAIRNFSASSQLLNKGILLVSDSNPTITYWMRHHDAQNNNQLMTAAVTDEYSERDRVVAVGHNLKEGESLTINIEFETITNDQTLFAEGFSAILKVLQPLTNLAFDDGVRAKMPVLLNGLRDTLIRLQAAVFDARLYVQPLTYLAAQRNPHKDIKPATDESGALHSFIVNPAKKIEGPKRAAYYLTKTTSNTTTAQSINATNATASAAVADTFTYRVNKLYRIFPMAGFAYTFTRFANVGYDSSANQHTKTNEKPIRFIVGAKVFIRKTDIRSPGWIWEKDQYGKGQFWSRTSLSVAVDVTEPLKNLYGGVGFDLLHGFCINAGVHLNRYRYNEYANKAITQSRDLYRAGFYIGVSTDVSLFADLVKFLNLAN